MAQFHHPWKNMILICFPLSPVYWLQAYFRITQPWLLNQRTIKKKFVQLIALLVLSRLVLLILIFVFVFHNKSKVINMKKETRLGKLAKVCFNLKRKTELTAFPCFACHRCRCWFLLYFGRFHIWWEWRGHCSQIHTFSELFYICEFWDLCR